MIHWCNIQTVIFAKIKDTQSFVDSQKVGGRQQAHEMTKERDRESREQMLRQWIENAKYLRKKEEESAYNIDYRNIKNENNNNHTKTNSFVYRNSNTHFIYCFFSYHCYARKSGIKNYVLHITQTQSHTRASTQWYIIHSL